jgi:plasmid stabilization system protein ParE
LKIGEKKLPILWDRMAKNHLDIIFNHIAKESIPAAKKVKKELIKLAHSLNDFPEKFPIEEYLADEPEIYRSVHKWNYKIIYEVTDTCIIIADIFQTSQHPSVMKKLKS